MTGAQKVLQAISAVMHDLAVSGIGKDGYNDAQKFAFRGIDAIHNALAPLLVKHKLVVIPKIIDRITERRERSGKDPLYFVTVRVEYFIASSEDGSAITAGPFYGEAMDSGDKATNKAMSIAYKYFAIQTFCIPLVGTDDPDLHGNSVLSEERVAELVAGFRAATTKSELRTLWGVAAGEAKDVGDHGAFGKLKAIVEEIAEKLPDVKAPQSKSAKAQPAEEPAPAKPTDSDEPKASPGLVKMIEAAVKDRGVADVGFYTGGIATKELTKSQAAALLKTLQELKT